MNNELKEKLIALNIVEDNEYLDKYLSIITSNTKTVRLKYKTQKHHIIPRVVFTHNKEPLDNSESNIVNLEYKDHILAHYYLYMCAIGWFKYPAAKAVDYLVKRIESIRVKPNEFNQIEINFSEEDLFTMLPELADIQEQAKIGEHNRLSGGKWVNNGKTQKYIGGADLREFLLNNDSWRVGKLPVSEETKEKRKQYKPSTSGRKVVNNGQQNKYVLPDELDFYLQAGWRLGRFDTSVQLGKPLSEETKRKISEASKGRIPYNKGISNPGFTNSGTWQKGNKPWNTGLTFSEETKAKMSAAKLGKRPKHTTKPLIWIEKNKLYEATMDAAADIELGLPLRKIRNILNGKQVVDGKTLRRV